jgi:hypothetical protein
LISGDSGDTESLENPQDKSTGHYPIDAEIILGPGTLWTAYPIPAVKVLTWSNNGRARSVLLGLLAFSGKRVGRVFPSVITIAQFSGVGRNNIKESLDILVKFGFINIEKTKVGRKNSRNSYTFNLGCWSYYEMNDLAKKFEYPRYFCPICEMYIFGYDLFGSKESKDGVYTMVRRHLVCRESVRRVTKKEIDELKG